ncbi:MAG: hypothetical protein KDC95_18755 [Planctomycetes bacterium]|nr:hypothetical protein [Planctomycetota bacterium]
MQALSVVLLTAVVAAGTSFAVVQFGPPREEPVQYGVGTSDEERIAKQARRIEALEAKLRELEAKPVAVDAPVRSGVDADLIAEAVDSWFERNKDRVLAQGASKGAGSKSGDKPAVTVDSLWASFLSGELQPHEIAEAWKDAPPEMRKALLAKFEQYAKERPNDVEAQYAYGQAISQRCMDAPVVEQARLGPLAIEMFDKALAIDSEHWASRFSKAMSLSFWPAVLGKQPEAIKNFEILIDQQERKTPKPEFEQSYVMLGNLKAQQGKLDEARDIWKRGLQLFPNSAALKAAMAK